MNVSVENLDASSLPVRVNKDEIVAKLKRRAYSPLPKMKDERKTKVKVEIDK